jgi:hypothetical protein
VTKKNWHKPIATSLLSLNPLNISPNTNLAIKYTVALSIISWPCHSGQEHDLLNVIFMLAFSLWCLLSMTQIHLLGLPRAVKPLLIDVNNIHSSLEDGIIL